MELVRIYGGKNKDDNERGGWHLFRNRSLVSRVALEDDTKVHNQSTNNIFSYSRMRANKISKTVTDEGEIAEVWVFFTPA
mmetsp:Transcript_12144/g.26577  ORF Transcript_12144/g.26577 Transcript_12144/m.26577 type:complete len:80 (+) Transcript_12144:1669-1908(+)